MTKKELRELELSCCFQPRYSGEDSRKIWSEINKSGNRTLYNFACGLQSIEATFLAVLNQWVIEAVRAAVKQRSKKTVRRRGKKK